MANFNVLMEKASGDYIVAAHDDDIQYPDRISRIMDAFLTHDVSMVTSNSVRIAANGDVIGPDKKAAEDRLIIADEFAATGWSPFVYGAALSWHRDVFDQFGPIDINGTARASDWIIPYRASLLKGIYYLKSPALSRRIHVNSRGAIGRNTDDQDIFVVETHSESITQLVYMLKTTQDALAGGMIGDAKHQSLAASIQELIVRNSQHVARARNRLHMRKLRATWIGHSAGAVTTSDVPNLGVTGDGMETLTPECIMATLPKRLSTRRKIVKAVKGTPWYWVALKNPLGIRYWWAVRRLQREFRQVMMGQQPNNEYQQRSGV